ncbi:MAG: peptidyl-prolyl cis-trans isomerase [Planctomycetota bacterium]|nr:MAG: peptidyl-prolyl cis-trans isomerase [Planctomycetota bacterium]
MPLFCSSCCSGSTSRNKLFAMTAGIIGGFATLVAAYGFTQPAGEGGASPADSAAKEPATVLVRLETTKGNIDIELNREKAPISVANFLEYVDKGHYNGTIFHRVIPNFMIQGGGFDKDMTQKPTGEGIENEWRNGLSNLRGTIAMARLGNQPNSATAQFFINVADNKFLDTPRDGAGYAVFGKVVEGMDVVDAIVAVPTTNKGPHQNVPVEPVIIKKASRVTDKNDG